MTRGHPDTVLKGKAMRTNGQDRADQNQNLSQGLHQDLHQAVIQANLDHRKQGMNT